MSNFVSSAAYCRHCCVAGVLVLSATQASAQKFPVKPVRIVTSALGSGSDFTARLVAQALSGRLGQQVIVDNRGLIGLEMVAKAPPDGYTLLAYGSPLWLSPLLRDNATWDVVRDFAPVSLTNSSPNLVIIHPSIPARSIRELIALAKARPAELNYGSGSSGSSTHLAVELFKSMAGVNIVRIPYKGGGQALSDLIVGAVHLLITSGSGVMPHIKSGRLRALAIASAEPSALAPGLPTVAASGLPGYEAASMTGVFAPAKTPVALITLLNQEIVRTLNTAEAKERLISVGNEAVGSSPEELSAKIKSEVVRMSAVIKVAGIREE